MRMSRRKSWKKKPGPKPLLTKELFSKIKERVLEGDDLRKIANTLQISESSLYTWHFKNYLNLADKIAGWRRDRKLMKAEMFSDELLDMSVRQPVITEDGVQYDVINPHILRTKQKEAEFVRETLGKDIGYSKRSELTGAGGEALIPVDEATKKKSDKALHDYLHPDNPR